MNKGIPVQDLVRNLVDIAGKKKDMIVNTSHIYPYVDSGGTPRIRIQEVDSYTPTKHMHRQLGTHTKVPAQYYDRMLAEAPSLWVNTMETWLTKSNSNHMVRTIDTTARAFLSDRYRRLDNEDVAAAAIPLLQREGVTIESCEVTNRRLYIKAVTDRTAAVVKDDIVQSGLVISNSEIGDGSLSVTPLIYRQWCLNGCIVNDAAWRRAHLGGKLDNDQVKYRDETIKADDKAIMMKLQDAISSCSGDVFDRTVEQLREAATGDPIKSPVKAVEVLASTMSLREDEQHGVLERLMKNQDYTKYGVLNALTNMANDLDDYDRATEFEAMGGKILTLNKSEWTQIAEAA